MTNTEFLKIFKKVKVVDELEIFKLKQFLQKSIHEKDEKFYDLYMKLFHGQRYYLTDEQNKKGKEYFLKRYLKSYGYLRDDKRIIFCKEDLRIIQLLFDCNNKYEFYFCGFACFTNGIINFYEPIYELTVKTNEKNYKFMYVHFNGIDYDIHINCNSLLKLNERFWLEKIL